MYFVVFSLDDKKCCVIPKNWIKDLQFEAIVNDVINSSRIFQCYFGFDENAWNEDFSIPNAEFKPDFGNDDVKKGVIHAQLVKYFGKFIRIVLALNLNYVINYFTNSNHRQLRYCLCIQRHSSNGSATKSLRRKIAPTIQFI